MNTKPTQTEITQKLNELGIKQEHQLSKRSGSCANKCAQIEWSKKSDLQASNIGLHLFSSLLDLYGTLWLREHGDTPSLTFCRWSHGLDKEKVQRVLTKARESLERGIKFPPATGELIVWSEMPTNGEFERMMYRVLNRNPESDIEKWIVQNRLYDLKRVAEHKMMGSLKRYYCHAVELQKEGALFPEQEELLALPVHSTKSLTDRTIEDFVERGGKNPLQARIDAIRGKKK